MSNYKSMKYNKQQMTEMIYQKYGYLLSVSISRDEEGLFYRITVPYAQRALIEVINSEILYEGKNYPIKIKIYGDLLENMPVAF